MCEPVDAHQNLRSVQDTAALDVMALRVSSQVRGRRMYSADIGYRDVGSRCRVLGLD